MTVQDILSNAARERFNDMELEFEGKTGADIDMDDLSFAGLEDDISETAGVGYYE